MTIKSLFFSRNHPLLGSITWETLRALGQSSMVRSSVYWIFLVPLAARILGDIQSPIKVRVFEQVHNINLTLPFSWYCLYFSAVSFAVGSLLYRMYCPQLISEFANFRDFLDSGGEGFRLESEIQKAIPEDMIHDSSIWKAFTQTITTNDKERNTFAPIHAQVAHGVRRIPSDKLGSLFYTIRDVVSYSHPGLVWLTAICFAFGIVLLAVVFMQNLNFVLIQLNGGVPLITWAA